MKTPTIVAHRGLHDEYPENSLKAMLAAWDAGIAWCECDVRGSLEHEPMLIHDESLERTTTGSGLVHQTSSTILHALNLRYQGGAIAAMCIPRFGTVMTSMPVHAKLLIEIKPKLAEDVVRRTLDLCRPESCVVQSFDPGVLWTAFACRPDVRLELLVEDARETIPAGPWRAVNADFKSLTADVMRRRRDRDYAVGAWTVNADEDIRRILSLEVDRIISDRPLRVRDICEEIG